MIYFFSGSLTDEMMDLLSRLPGYEPIDVLVSQLDRPAITKMIKWRKEGLINRLFIDSGAFSFHTGKAKVDLEEYISYLNSIDDSIFVCAQLDTIPGHFGKPKSKEDYEESAKKSWDNFLYMRTKLKSPEKLMPVFHFGESFDVLGRMLSWRDENGHQLEYVGISPANDASQAEKNTYLQNVGDYIAASSNPNVKTHYYGMTSIDALAKYPCYSADSISHRLMAAYCKVYHPKFGVVSVSKKSRTVKSKSNMSFLETADESALKEMTDYIEGLGFTLDQAIESSSVRVVICMYTIMQEVKKINSGQSEKAVRSKKLFSI